jgi:hypothetical protein
MLRLLQIREPNARKIITEIANNPRGYRRSELVQTPGLSERAPRGQLSSVSSALRRMDKKASPILREKVDGNLPISLIPLLRLWLENIRLISKNLPDSRFA